jgi:23S rRNA pseudouridine1911/1915/1917 synthase
MEIIWEDENIAVINKPAGITTNKIVGVEEETVQSWVLENVKLSDLEYEPMKSRGGLAHRLDKETSGVLLIAKNVKALKHLMNQFKKRLTKKEYLALIHGRLEPKKGVIKLPIKRNDRNRQMQEVHFEGKQSETEWEVEKYYDNFSLVRVRPKTGRMHQIRVHLSHLGHPIFADEKYLNKKKRVEDRKVLKSHFLHAAKIGFFDMNGKWQEVESPLPQENADVLSNLG